LDSEKEFLQPKYCQQLLQDFIAQSEYCGGMLFFYACHIAIHCCLPPTLCLVLGITDTLLTKKQFEQQALQLSHLHRKFSFVMCWLFKAAKPSTSTASPALVLCVHHQNHKPLKVPFKPCKT